MTSSSPPIAQNRPASVMSIPIRVRRQERDVAAQQPEAAVDIVDEGRHEAVDDVEVAHEAQLSTDARMRCRGAPARGSRKPRGGHQAAAALPPVPIRCSSCAWVAGPMRKRCVVGAAVLFRLRAPRAVDRRCAIFGRHQILELELLLDAERQQLVGGLAAPASAPTAPWLLAASSFESAGIGLRHFRRPAPGRSSPACRRPSRHRARARACATCWLPVSAWPSASRGTGF